MKVLLLVCSGEIIASMLADKVKSNGGLYGIKIATQSFSSIKNKKSIEKFNSYDLLIIWTNVNLDFIKLSKNISYFDGILLTPPIRYILNSIESVVKNTNTFCEFIDVRNMVTMDGEGILKQIIVMIENK
ncbi:hypothetical protein [Clostridium sp. YIM B02551]|uniref:hypothetical protein n=1 Tax=Clostridium sp. YIM B02551 TaxID=2910679 RepID=UPI001EEA6DF6|nr:hypothetical protein [Clostridium sp. YIM B02551]